MNETNQEMAQEEGVGEIAKMIAESQKKQEIQRLQPLAPIDPDLLARFESAIEQLTKATEAASRVFQGDDSLTTKYVNERVTKLDEKIERVITTVTEMHNGMSAITDQSFMVKARVDRVAAFCAALAPLLDKHLNTKDFTALLPEKRNGPEN